MKMTMHPKSFLVGLGACLRQAALSLHRASSIAELSRYYDSERIQELSKAIEVLQSTPVTGRKVEGRPPSLARPCLRLRAWFSWWLSGFGRLPSYSLSNAVSAAEEFLSLLETGSDIDIDAKNDLRMRLDRAVEDIFRFIPDQGIVATARNVAHFGQAPHVEVKEVNEIAGDSWNEVRL